MNRIDKVNAEIKRQISETIEFGLKDPRVKGNVVSILRVDTTNDLKYCKVYVSILGDSQKEAFEGIKSANGYIRSALAGKLSIRCVPELIFILDDSIEYGMKIDKILRDLK